MSDDWSAYSPKSSKKTVHHYKFGPDWLVLEFDEAKEYEYNFEVTGAEHVKEMVRLAKTNEGLVEYIDEHRPKYADKWPPGDPS